MRFASLSAVVLAGGLACASALSQDSGTEYKAPPRSVEDILAVLDQYKPTDKPLSVERPRVAADAEPPATDNASALAQFHLERSRSRGLAGQRSKQIEDLRRAAELAKGTMAGATGTGGARLDDGDEARILYELSQAERAGGNFVNAVRAREAMVAGMQNQGRPRPGPLFVGLSGLAAMNAALGDMEAASEYMARTERIFPQLRGIPPWTWNQYLWSAGLERTRASVFAAQGKYPAAEASFRKAVQFMDQGRATNRDGWRKGLSTLPPVQYMNIRNADEAKLAWVMALQGRLAEAEAASRNVLVNALSFHGRYHGATAMGLSLLSRIVFEQGRYRDAALLAGAGADIFLRTGVAPEAVVLAEARKSHGAALVAQGQWREATAVYAEMQEGLAHDAAVLRHFGAGDINWAYALVRERRGAEATAMLRQLLDTYSKRLGEEDRYVAELRGYLGIALTATGDRAGGLAAFRRAVPVLLDGARADQASETGGIARSMRLTNVLEAYLALLADLHRTGQAPAGLDAAAEAFVIADVARSSNVQRALAASAARAAIRDPRLADMARQEQDAQHRIGVLSDLLSRLLAAPPEQQLTKIIGDVRRDLEALRKTQGQLRQQISRGFPEYASLTEPRPTTIAQVQAALRPGEALVAVYLGADEVYTWGVPQRGAAAFATAAVPRERISASVAALRKALDVGDVSLERFPAFDLKSAYALFADTLKAVEPAWKDAKSLLVVPHGALGQLPFAVLPTEPHELKRDTAERFAGYREVPWLIKRTSITQLPSVSTLATLRRAAAPAPGRREFLGFGDPLFTKGQMAPAAPGAKQIAEASLRSIGLRNLTVASVKTVAAVEADPDADPPQKPQPTAVSNSATMAQLAALPDTSEEILSIAQVLGADPSQDVYLRERANESLLKKLDLSKRRIIAFATHGLVPGDLNGLTQPALALTAQAVAGGEDDGLLTMEEVLALKLDADWVVLSACNTGSSDGAGGEAVSGLGRAFFYAGARSLLVSNWPVETVSARILTTDIFRRQSADTALTRAEALRQTMLALMDGPGAGSGISQYAYAHPMFWAPFSLVGDGSVR
jgi:CHAT domain-containing protein